MAWGTGKPRWLELAVKALDDRDALDPGRDEHALVYPLGGQRTHHDRIVRGLGRGADSHMMRLLLRWCERQGVWVHPALEALPAAPGENLVFRDHEWRISRDLPALTPLLAIPERLCIGFKDTDSQEDLDALKRGTTPEARESIDDTQKDAAGTEESDGDMCAFFFNALGLLANDILVALNNDVSDPRHLLARSLQKIRTCHNAPYLSAGTFATGPSSADGEPSLAEVFLQMVHNYIQSGPLTGKVERDMLNWAVSVALSHSTPLTIAGRRSIGVVPLLHLIPHGQDDVNAVPITRRRVDDGAALAHFFTEMCPAMAVDPSQDYIFLATIRPLSAGTPVALQAMAPVCNRTSEADSMWRLTCGGPPPDGSVSSADYQEILREAGLEVHRQARELLREDAAR